jgi:hypothetical protein
VQDPGATHSQRMLHLESQLLKRKAVMMTFGGLEILFLLFGLGIFLVFPVVMLVFLVLIYQKISKIEERLGRQE